MHRFRDMTTYWLKIVEKTQTPLIWHRRAGKNQTLEKRGVTVKLFAHDANKYYLLSTNEAA